MTRFSKNKSQKKLNAKSEREQLRIVTTTPSGTELVEALGQSSQLVGVDNYSTFPKAVSKLPKVGNVVTPNIDAIVALKPDLVVLDAEQVDAKKQLKNLGIKTFVTEMKSIEDMRTSLSGLGHVLGEQERAENAQRHLEKVINAPSPKAENKRKVLVVIERTQSDLESIRAAGPGSHIDVLLKKAGFENALSGATEAFPKIRMDEMNRDEPTLILDLSNGGNNDLHDWFQNPHFSDLKVTSLSDAHLLAPTPRLEESIAALRSIDN